jgi:hypothetical protein
MLPRIRVVSCAEHGTAMLSPTLAYSRPSAPKRSVPPLCAASNRFE